MGMEKTLSDAELARMPNAIRAKFLEKLNPLVGVLPYNLGIPILADPDRIVTTVLIADGARTIAAQPDVPRNLTCTLTDANNSVSAVITYLGEDPCGRVISEVQTIVLGVGKVWTGVKIFAKVTSVTVSGESGADGPATDMMVVGVGNVIGLGVDIDATAAVRHVYLGAARQATPTIAIGVSTSGVDASAGTYDGAKLLQAWVAIARQV